MEGDFFIGAALGSTMTKLALRFCGLVADTKKQNRFTGECMLVITSVMHLGVSGLPEKRITRDDLDRLNLCLKVNKDISMILKGCTLSKLKYPEN
jgi:coatomer subunit beta